LALGLAGSNLPPYFIKLASAHPELPSVTAIMSPVSEQIYMPAPQSIIAMDLVAGRAPRERRPTEKVKDTTVKKEEPKKEEPASGQLVPPKYKLPDYDPKWFEQPKEIPKIYHHTKINEETGEKFDFYKLGPQ
jgi:hypothetical protein